MQITVKIESAIILLLSCVIITCGAYFYRSYELQHMTEQIKTTQKILVQINFPISVANALRNLGWETRIIKPTNKVKEKEGKITKE